MLLEAVLPLELNRWNHLAVKPVLVEAVAPGNIRKVAGIPPGRLAFPQCPQPRVQLGAVIEPFVEVQDLGKFELALVMDPYGFRTGQESPAIANVLADTKPG